LYVLRLGSRRNLDFDLSADSHALANVNRLAGTNLPTRPVHDTLDYYLAGGVAEGLRAPRRRLAYRLLRSTAVGGARIQGRQRLLVDGAGRRALGKKHGDRCLVQRRQTHTA